MSLYLKAIAAVVIAAVGALVVALGTGNTDFGDISGKSWLIALATVLASGAVVWWTENGPAAPAIKAIVGFLSAGVGALVIALEDDVLTRAEQLTAFGVAVAALAAVFQLTNKPSS